MSEDAGRRIKELLEANNRYQQEARDERRRAAARLDELTLVHTAWKRALGGTILNKRHLIDALVLTTQRAVERAAYADRLDAIRDGRRSGIYVASKTVHAPMWRQLRAAGLPIKSTWIDEAGAGESKDLGDLWTRIVAEASTAKCLLVYRLPSEVLKGAFVELGIAVAVGVPVFAVGLREFTVANLPQIEHFDFLEPAIARARDLVKAAA